MLPNNLPITDETKVTPDNIFFQQFAVGLITLFYLISAASNIYLFHFVLDINLAKIGMLVAIFGYGVLINTHVKTIWKNLKTILFVCFSWITYLVVNSLLGATPLISLKLTLRVAGCFFVAFEIGLLLSKNRKYLNPLLISFFIGLLTITVIWYLDRNHIFEFEYFKKMLPGYLWQYGARPNASSGLFINTNELGAALVMLLTIILWFSLHSLYSLIVFPIATFLVSAGVLQTNGRNPTIALIATITLWSVTYGYLLRRNTLLKYKRHIVLGFIFFILVIGPVVLIQMAPERVQKSFIAAGEFGKKDLIESIIHLDLDRIEIVIPNISMRIKLWKLAFREWRKTPWIGMGIGSFHTIQKFGEGYNTHNFLVGVLTEQGIVGFGILIVFSVVLLMQMTNFHGFTILCTIPLSFLFDDTSWSYSFPIFTSLILGYCIFIVIQHPQGCISQK